MSGNADNFALKPAFADEHLSFQKAELVRVDAVRDSGYDIKVLDTATKLGPKGEILWRGRGDQWVIKDGDALRLAVENGKWVGRDGAGEVVEPE